MVGPGLGAAVLARWGFQGTFVVTAACFVLAALPLLGVPEKQPPRHRAAPAQAAARRHPLGNWCGGWRWPSCCTPPA
ncbi:hypothetical protein [Deinococcus cavernae]|uniref:hypothetical protein n=1 Tax=Deinococcus cavernae TaxID=2320857 RepID=UPI001F367D8A|nr:hypothetical protein [Deinococcus cavernae]